MDSPSLDRTILQFEICDLLSRYSHALDSGRVFEAVAMFVEDGAFDAAVGDSAVGHDQLTAYFAAQQTEPDWLPYRGGQHLNTNTVIYSREGDDVRSTTDFIYVVPTDDGPAIKFLGRYEDVIRWDGAAWKFVRRTVTANPCAPSWTPTA
jgi:hypothetical protein